MKWGLLTFLLPWIMWGQFQKGYLVARLKSEELLFAFQKNYVGLIRDLKIFSIQPAFPWSKAFTDRTYYHAPASSVLRRLIEIHLDSTINLDLATVKLLQTGYFDYVEKWIEPELLYTPNDAYVAQQYYLGKIQAFDAWDFWKGDTNMVIGIVDTGIDFNHPDLWNAVKYNYNDPIDGVDNDQDGFVDNFQGWDFGTNDNNPQYQTLGHGVHVSGIAGASADNLYGIAGVGFLCKILLVKIDNAYGSLSGAYAGVIYAAEHGARVINCSWGATYYTQFGQDIVDYVTEVCGSLVVAACGNTGSDIRYYPASYRYVLSVAATDQNDIKWNNSSFNTMVDLAAPGHNVLSTWPGPTFVSSSGTSMAAPIVSAVAAVVASYYPHLSMLQVAERLRTTADIIDTLPSNLPFRGKLGKGRVNLYRALTDSFDKSSVRLLRYQLSDHNDEVFISGDTVFLTMQITNYLAPTSPHFYVQIQTNSPGVVIHNPIWHVDSLATLQSADNSALPFLIKLSNVVPNQSISLKVEFIDSVRQYYDSEMITFFVNPDYVDLNVNKVMTTITSKGNFAYNDYPTCLQGRGFIYDNSSILGRMIGIIIGNSTTAVSDNVYGVNTVSNDFVRLNFAHYVLPAPRGDQFIETTFTDSQATNPLQVTINQHVYAFEDSPDQDYLITQYYVVNTGTNPIQNLYMGLFADWDITPASNNRVIFDPTTKSLIAFDIDSTFFVATKILDAKANEYAYACDVDGFNGSIAITDGFTEVEKYQMLKSNRFGAGMDIYGRDVACMVSSGPYQLAPTDTLILSFLIAAGKSLSQIKSTITRAVEKFHNPFLEINSFVIPSLRIYPNPVAGNQFNFTYPIRGLYEVEIYSAIGQQVSQWQWLDDRTIQIDLVPSGLYFVHCVNHEDSYIIPIIVTQQ